MSLPFDRNVPISPRSINLNIPLINNSNNGSTPGDNGNGNGSGTSNSNSNRMFHGSPSSMYPPLPQHGDMSMFENGNTSTDEEGVTHKRKRLSMPGAGNGNGNGMGIGMDNGTGTIPGRSATLGGMSNSSGDRDEGEWEGDAGRAIGHGKVRANSHGGVPTLTSCEACRKGKRRCEPSPLVPPTHPDAAKLPCARCRRFALDCVRVRVARRKGPAPVDLSAISDAVHGFVPSSDIPTGILNDEIARRQSQEMPMIDMAQVITQNSGSGFNIPSNSFPILAASPGLTIMPNDLDQVVAGHVIDSIIGLFFDYVYPLTPCLHRPTFIANLSARKDRTDPVFFALTLAVFASTLVQVPRALVSLDKDEIESLARRCIRVARSKVAFIWEEPVPVQSSYVVISYLEGIVHLVLGNNTAHVVATAQANQLALALRLNEESSYDILDPIECEMRRRIYWLLFQADKSAACMRARTISLRLEDAAALRLPTEVDDEQITPNGILPQPLGRTPLIAGFNITTNLFRILNDALLLQRRKAPPTVDSVLADLSNVNELREKVMLTTLEVAAPLQLRRAYDSRHSSPAHDWEAKLQERFLDFFQTAGDTDHALNSFLVMQGNILVTQNVVRLVLLQTRESLFAQLAMLTQMPLDGVSTMTGLQSPENAEDIATELLDGLNSLPVECVATNGPSLVQKVRFIAIQLMECSVSPSPTTARAQRLLMQFLSVLSVIEGMYSFGREISAE